MLQMLVSVTVVNRGSGLGRLIMCVLKYWDFHMELNTFVDCISIYPFVEPPLALNTARARLYDWILMFSWRSSCTVFYWAVRTFFTSPDTSACLIASCSALDHKVQKCEVSRRVVLEPLQLFQSSSCPLDMYLMVLTLCSLGHVHSQLKMMFYTFLIRLMIFTFRSV